MTRHQTTYDTITVEEITPGVCKTHSTGTPSLEERITALETAVAVLTRTLLPIPEQDRDRTPGALQPRIRVTPTFY